MNMLDPVETKSMFSFGCENFEQKALMILWGSAQSASYSIRDSPQSFSTSLTGVFSPWVIHHMSPTVLIPSSSQDGPMFVWMVGAGVATILACCHWSQDKTGAPQSYIWIYTTLIHAAIQMVTLISNTKDTEEGGELFWAGGSYFSVASDLSDS